MMNMISMAMDFTFTFKWLRFNSTDIVTEELYQNVTNANGE